MLRYSPGSRSFSQLRAAQRRAVRASGPKTPDASVVSLENEPAANIAHPDVVIASDGTEIPLVWDIA